MTLLIPQSVYILGLFLSVSLFSICWEYYVYNWYMEFNFLGVKIIYLKDRIDLFKISNLVLCGEAIVMDFYISLEGQREHLTFWLLNLSGSNGINS
jgi:hypothetical protein